MMAVSALVGICSGLIGLYISYYAGVSSGAAIALTATLFFLLAKAWSFFRNALQPT
jgi:manganese/iron transport system permease protein